MNTFIHIIPKVKGTMEQSINLDSIKEIVVLHTDEAGHEFTFDLKKILESVIKGAEEEIRDTD